MADRPAKSRSAANVEIDQAFRSAILERNPAPIAVFPEHTGIPSQSGLERRDLIKGTAPPRCSR